MCTAEHIPRIPGSTMHSPFFCILSMWEGWKHSDRVDGTFLALLLLPPRALHHIYLSSLLYCQHLSPVSSSYLPADSHSAVHCYPLVYRQFFVSPSLFCAVMPQSPAIITATAAIARERAGRRGQGPHPRHPRPMLPDDAPDVSVELTHELWPLFPCLLSFFCLVMSRFFVCGNHKLTRS